jgi:hypothetical protein
MDVVLAGFGRRPACGEVAVAKGAQRLTNALVLGIGSVVRPEPLVRRLDRRRGSMQWPGASQDTRATWVVPVTRSSVPSLAYTRRPLFSSQRTLPSGQTAR